MVVMHMVMKNRVSASDCLLEISSDRVERLQWNAKCRVVHAKERRVRPK